MSAPKRLNPFRMLSLVLIVLCAAALGGGAISGPC